ncbi:ribonuclease H-like domain-containing protein [Mycena pura]|uniref:Ribonuclease H-like domain-containing protein n=1 Tax=Mycena pura TaxID=153505 RepID=A0AAD6UTZ0_9AGAR|nr:ribonuclease H-like domain-containing protein [Mycena pura]
MWISFFPDKKKRSLAVTVDDPEDEQEFDAEDDVELIQVMEDVDEAVEESDEAAIKDINVKEMLEARHIQLELREEDHELAQGAYRKELAAIATSLKIDNAEKKHMICAVLTRWNTIFNIINRGLNIQPALDRLCLTSTGQASIRLLLLSNEEWQIMHQLHSVLKPFKDATLCLSTNKHPCIFEVIPIIDLLNIHLKAMVRKTKNTVFVHPKDLKAPKTKTPPPPPAQRATFPVSCMAAATGIGILDKYYSKTDDSIMYHIAMLMHPSYGLSYFEQMEWPKDWQDTAVALACKQWTKHYCVKTPATIAEIVTPRAIFDSLDQLQKTTALVGTMLPYAADSSPNNQVLVLMAQDFLGAPATSVDVECAFSHGGSMVTKCQHALSAETIRANVLVAAWCGADLIPESKAIESSNMIDVDAEEEEEEGSDYSDE